MRQTTRNTLRFLALYLVLMGVALTLIGAEPVKRVIDLNGVYTRVVVTMAAWVFKMLGVPTTHDGAILNLPGLALEVCFGCNGLEAFLIYGVAVLAFPSSLASKAYGLLGGLLGIQLLNIVRIVALGLVGVHLPRLFEYFHIYVAQGIMIAVALAMFLFWINRVQEAD